MSKGKKSMTISVRTLVEFLLREGDLDEQNGTASEDAMLEGSRMHRKIQEEQEGDYRAEVVLDLLWDFEAKGPHPDSKNKKEDSEDPSLIYIEGRADGIYTGLIPQDAEGSFLLDTSSPSEMKIIDEIKTTYKSLRNMKKADPVHLAQAKCYAYFYALESHLGTIGVRMTYCQLKTKSQRCFYSVYTLEELEAWFSSLMEQLYPWVLFHNDWEEKKIASIKNLYFPFPYRPGQKELAQGVYCTIIHEKKLFLEAPTGTGKTLAVLFPSLKAVGERKAELIFYLTAKTMTGTAAQDALDLLRKQGLRLKSIVLTAKEKECILDEPECTPSRCPRAKGHYDRINAAMYDLLTHEDAFNRSTIDAYAEKHNVCPFALSMDMSLLSDMIIGDYNYLFDPHAYLRRFFGEGNGGKKKDIFLIDEAHNLVERAREMYSASLTQGEILSFRKSIRGIWPRLYRKLGSLSKKMLSTKDDCKEQQEQKEQKGQLPEGIWTPSSLDSLIAAITDVDLCIHELLEEDRGNEEKDNTEDDSKQKKKQAHKDLLSFYFEIEHFLAMASNLDDHYVVYGQNLNGKDFMVRLYCVNPGLQLQACMDRGRASILFSATLLPITYYKSLLGGTKDDYEIYAESSFNPEKLGLFLVRDVTSRYRDRTRENYIRIADCIYRIVKERNGNYLVFFPSYAFMEEVLAPFSDQYGDCGMTILVQQTHMEEKEKENFLSSLEQTRDENTLLGFCVMGGIFSEGIDVKGNSLIGSIIVGTGLPKVSSEREILKHYFDERDGCGYDYAYRFPGMNRVLQAAGRVIRTKDDVGIVVLLDERFAQTSYRTLYPREWKNVQLSDSRHIGHDVEKFWNEWLV